MYNFIKKSFVNSSTSKYSTFKIYSEAFKPSGSIPKKYTGQGEDVIPPLKWEGAPKNTKSFALIVDDPDASDGTWTHWLVKDIDYSKTEIKEGEVPGTEVINSWGVKDWKGPLPPSGTHRYFFKLYALNTEKLGANNLKDFYEKVKEHAIEETELMVKYIKH